MAILIERRLNQAQRQSLTELLRGPTYQIPQKRMYSTTSQIRTMRIQMMQTHLTTHSNIRRWQDVLCDADASDEGADAADDDDAVEIRR